ncbi:hypothetical protein [Streptomyces sp. NPDC046887]|uniref:hypothetical protein n=1 Tax=Streptomyces sp. NPDC046887 TaxID=3155472 RepID=UPI0033E3AE26
MTVHTVAGRLPGITEPRDHCRAPAALEAVVCPDPGWHAYTCSRRWSETAELPG